MPLPPKLQARHECLTLIVLGATGNLAQRKLFPSLFNLFAAGRTALTAARTLLGGGDAKRGPSLVDFLW